MTTIPERITPAELERIRNRHADIEQDELCIDEATTTTNEDGDL